MILTWDKIDIINLKLKEWHKIDLESMKNKSRGSILVLKNKLDKQLIDYWYKVES